ncbi:MAG: hypothetical protein IPM57_07645 [Oligoflexia bacterium]|nr:hypothetical protein [Oligoflexia bacterium]
MKHILLSFVALTLLTSCNIKPPTDDMEGNPVSADEVQSALDEAQAEMYNEKSYKVGDFGTVRIIDQILSQSEVAASADYKVVEINDKFIVYSIRDAETGEQVLKSIEKVRPQGALKNKAKEATTLFAKIKTFATKVVALFKKVEITRPTAVGQEKLEPLRRVKTFSLDNQKLKLSSEDDNTVIAVKYFDLKVLKHPYETANCAQIPNCKVNSTRISFYEVQTLKDGTILKVKWIYEISKDVPGLFMNLEECFSTLAQSGTHQVPYMRCRKVKDFRFGGS